MAGYYSDDNSNREMIKVAHCLHLNLPVLFVGIYGVDQCKRWDPKPLVEAKVHK